MRHDRRVLPTDALPLAAEALTVPLDLRSAFDVVDLLGVLTNGILGAAVARSMRFDLVGFLVLGVISGLGGGLLRDTLLQVPPVALHDAAYLPTALVGAVVGYLMTFEGRWAGRSLMVADALALGCWAATGTVKAHHAGLAPIPSVLLGLITAVGGGMVRDILVGRPPAVFGGNTLYAVPALVGSVIVLVGAVLDVETLAFALAIVVTAVFALLARWRGWQLPGEAPRLALQLRRRRRRRRGPAEEET